MAFKYVPFSSLAPRLPLAAFAWKEEDRIFTLFTDAPETDQETDIRISANVPFDQINMPLWHYPIPPCITTEYWHRRLLRVSKTWGKYTMLRDSTSRADNLKALTMIHSGMFYEEALKKIRQDLYRAVDIARLRFGKAPRASWDLTRIGVMKNGRVHTSSVRFRGIIATAAWLTDSFFDFMCEKKVYISRDKLEFLL